MAKLPFIFTYRETVYGNGFLAEVRAKGRVLAVQEEGEKGWWMHGVSPGDISASGKDPSAAHAGFRQSFRAVLFDVAGASPDFEQFKGTVSEWFSQSNVAVLDEWSEAVESVRQGGLADRTDMPVEPADSPPLIEVTLREQTDFRPSANVLETEPALAA